MLELGILASADAQNGFRNRSHRTARSCHWKNGQSSFGTSGGRERFRASRCPQAVCEPGLSPIPAQGEQRPQAKVELPPRPHLQNCASRVPFQRSRGVLGRLLASRLEMRLIREHPRRRLPGMGPRGCRTTGCSAASGGDATVPSGAWNPEPGTRLGTNRLPTETALDGAQAQQHCYNFH